MNDCLCDVGYNCGLHEAENARALADARVFYTGAMLAGTVKTPGVEYEVFA